MTQHAKNQENGTCSQVKRKSTECDPQVNQMLELKDKDFNVVVIIYLNAVHDEWKGRKFPWRNRTIKKKQMKILDPQNTNAEIKKFEPT